MKDYQLRVVEERNQLYTKILKLAYHLKDHQSSILSRQLNAMKIYLAILDERIQGV